VDFEDNENKALMTAMSVTLQHAVTENNKNLTTE